MNASMHNNCTKLRRMLIKSGTLNLSTGASTITQEEWMTRACGVPLFSDAEKKRGTCRSCDAGWTHPNNYPVNESK